MKSASSQWLFHLNKKSLFIGTVLAWTGFIVLLLMDRPALSGLFREAQGYSLLQYCQEINIFFLGSALIFLLPGLLWTCTFLKQQVDTFELLAYSFVTSLSILAVLTTLFKILSPTELNQLNFTMITIIVTIAGLIGCLCKGSLVVRTLSISKMSLVIIFILLMLASILVWLFQDQLIWVNFDHNFSPEYVLNIPLGMQGDVFEKFGLIDSLKSHLLPYWDLEYVNRFGYPILDPPLHVFMSLFLILPFGMSLPYLPLVLYCL